MQMRYEIKSINLWPLIKVSFFFNLVVGFLFGLLYALLFGFIMAIISQLSQFQPEFFEFGPIESMPIGLMIVVMPIVFAILGAIFYTIIGVILVFIYNLIAKLVGGFELELAPVAGTMPLPPGQPLTAYTAAPTYVAPTPPGPMSPSTPLTTPQAPPPPQSPTDTNPDQPTEGKPES